MRGMRTPHIHQQSLSAFASFFFVDVESEGVIVGSLYPDATHEDSILVLAEGYGIVLVVHGDDAVGGIDRPKEHLVVLGVRFDLCWCFGYLPDAVDCGNCLILDIFGILKVDSYSYKVLLLAYLGIPVVIGLI